MNDLQCGWSDYRGRPLYYILDGHTPVPCEDVLTWGKWFQDTDRHVARDHVGKVYISTVFLGLDHGFSDVGAPVLFESMVFGGPLDETMLRYATWTEAEAGHQDLLECITAMVERLRRYDALRQHERTLRFPKPKRTPRWRPCSVV